ncbi:MAG: zf-HC2 domain-containing protein [Spirochaetaceae bacterium]|jgi:hypothetical protein|nr:zf-HC2 domain-containing protein [Spirochaetaceae bacterium]
MCTCPEQDLHSAYVDGEVNSPWREKIEAHLASCESCRESVAKLEGLRNVLRGDIHNMTAEELSRSFGKLRAKMDYPMEGHAGNMRHRFHPGRAIIPAMAAALLAAVILPAAFINGAAKRGQSGAGMISSVQEYNFIRDSVVFSDEELREAAVAAFGHNASYQSDMNLRDVSFPSIEICPPRFSGRENRLRIRLPVATEIFFSSQEYMAFEAVMQ